MAIKWTKTELNAEANIKVEPRLGGGKAIKDFGFIGETLTLTGMGKYKVDFQAARDLTTVREVRTIVCPFGGGYTKALRLLIRRAPITPIGGGWFEVRPEAEVIAADTTVSTT